MKTRTLLLLSVGTALMILLAGGVLFFQLASQDETSETNALGVAARIGDVEVTVDGSRRDGDLVRVDVEIGGVDDQAGIESFALVTGDQRLTPLLTPADGRCVEIDQAMQECTIDFDVSASEGTSRVLVVRRGDDQANWRLT